jgi:hypothetical protein
VKIKTNLPKITSLPLSRLIFSLAFGLSLTTPSLRAAGVAKPGSHDELVLDTLVMGVASSEKDHRLVDGRSEVVEGGLKEPGRRLLPLSPAAYTGGQVAFTMAVDPVKPNYFTAKFWGSDAGEDRGRLILFCQGKQIGYRHLGDVDLLNIPNDDLPYNDRFYYITTPLPLSMTKGKTSISIEIRSIGRIWGYGTTWDKYQKKLERPTVAVYRVYTHTDGFFAPPASEPQGSLPAVLPVRSGPGKEVLDTVKSHVAQMIDSDLKSPKPLAQDHIKLLALGYTLPWTPAYRNPRTLQRVTESVDALLTHPKSGFASTNDDWVGWGSAAFAVATLAEPLGKSLDQELGTYKNGQHFTRRQGWSGLFQYSRDSRRAARRQYTNQAMILDMNVYLANRAIELIDPASALPEAQCLHYLYQAVGLEPWLGSDTPNGPAKPMGDRYFLTTQKGLTKELGYVGYYGEVLDWATSLYLATAIGRPEGDAKIKAQVEKLAKARSYFRYPAVDDEGYRAMRIEAVVGWRDAHYPGEVAYAQRDSWDGSPSYEAADVGDPASISYVQQMLADGQYFQDIQSRLKNKDLRSTIGLVDIPSQYAIVAGLPAVGRMLPMTWSNPDFAWADEEDGVVAVKHGREILYVSLYWRARYGINHLARVHFLTPDFDRISTVHEEAQFLASGRSAKREDWVDSAFARSRFSYGDIHQAQAGEEMPIAIPYKGYPVKPGQEDPAYGRAEFYLCRYGRYLIAMNSSEDKTFTVPVPAGVISAPDLIGGKTLSLTAPLKLAPKTTVILYLEQVQSSK